jgi:hypothetical protein
VWASLRDFFKNWFSRRDTDVARTKDIVLEAIATRVSDPLARLTGKYSTAVSTRCEVNEERNYPVVVLCVGDGETEYHFQHLVGERISLH